MLPGHRRVTIQLINVCRQRGGVESPTEHATHRTDSLHDCKATRFSFDMCNTSVRQSLTPSEVANLLARHEYLRSFSNDMPSILVCPPSCRCICLISTRLSLMPKRSLNRSSTACATHARQEPGMETSSLVASLHGCTGALFFMGSW